ncbi:MAG TPA: LamG-like jellyroll fold domain-containing protein [Alphaproteobacteria bacterium]|nr:LamG-like jellyroll fold domain-containing protein [Alphaproteobacteria bacterium]
MAFDDIPYALNSVRDILPGVNGIELNPKAHLANAVEQAYAFFSELGPYADDLGPNRRHAKASGTAWKPNPTVGGFGVKLAGSTGYGAAPGHQLRPWSRECLFVYGASGAQGISDIAESPGGGAHDRTLYVNSSNLIAVHLYDGSTQIVAGTTVLTVGQAYHATVTCSNSLLSIYLNGVLEGSIAVSNAGYQEYTTPELVFGYGNTNGGTPAGTANTIFWHVEYNSVLSAADVMHRYLNQMEMFRVAQPRMFAGAVAGGDTILNPSDLTDSSGFETPAITQAHNLSAAKAACAFSAETPGILQIHNMNVADAFFAESFETPVLALGGSLSPTDAFFAESFEAPGIMQAHLFSVQELNSAFQFDLPVLALSAAGAPGFRTHPVPNGARSKSVQSDSRSKSITE